jgi:hypothetical protein
MRFGAEALGADYISVSAHKIYGPKGVGALYAAPGAPVSAIIRSGEQEGGMRAGTENVAGIPGLMVNSPPGGAPHIISVSAAGVEAEGCLFFSFPSGKYSVAVLTDKGNRYRIPP